MKQLFFSNMALSNYVLIGFLLAFQGSVFSKKNDLHNDKEKIYIHLDKSDYYAGEDIWFKTYLVNASTHGPDDLSKVVYVELISPTNDIVQTKTIEILDGGGAGDFKLSGSLMTGDYTIRAYTNYMRNFDQAYFFSKRVHIKALKLESDQKAKAKKVKLKKSKPSLQFFPVGGYLVNDCINKVGFKILNNEGYGFDFNGIVKDHTGLEILRFKSTHLGMGAFYFIPEPNKSYTATIINDKEEFNYPIPASLTKGVIIKVIEQPNIYRIHLRSSLDNGLQNFSLLGAQRDGVVFNSKVENKKKNAIIKVPKSILTAGIVQFTLIDDRAQRVLERLAFYEAKNTQPKVDITANKEVYQKRELVELEISLDTVFTQEVYTDFSISVTDRSLIQSKANELDIKSYLLLKSELKGHIEQPGYYFYSDDPKRKQQLDLLMLTQGWRQFTLNDRLENPAFLPEEGLSLSGTIKKFYKQKKSAAAEVSLTYNNTKEMAYESVITDEMGRFAFNNLDFRDSTLVVVQAKNIDLKVGKKLKESDKSFQIELDSFSSPEVKTRVETDLTTSTKELEINTRPTMYLQSLAEFQKGAEKLDEVLLKQAYIKKKGKYNKKRVLHREASQTIDFTEVDYFAGIDPLRSLEGRVPGLRIVGDPVTGMHVYLRANNSFTGNSTAHIIIDNVPADADAAITIPTSEIHFIDIIKGPRAAIYGSKGGGGVIAIYTKNGTEESKEPSNYKRKGIINLVHPGYHQARKFYEPVYTSSNKNDGKIDYRSTIYWNPNLTLNKEGKLKVSFYAADFNTSYKVDLQGMTSTGQIIKEESVLRVE